MATSRNTTTFILDHLGHADRFTVRAMFGEYALYADGKVVGLICDDQLFVKIMPETTALEVRSERAPAYPGSKEFYLVPEEVITGDRDLPAMLLHMASNLPFPKAKRPTKKA